MRNILILMILLSCSPQREVAENPRQKDLMVSGTLTLPQDSVSGINVSTLQLLIGDKNEYLYADDPACRCINVYSLTSRTLVKKIPLAKDGPDRIPGSATSMYVHHPDSIFILSHGIPRLNLINGQGQMLKVFNLPGMTDTGEKGYNSFPTGTNSNRMFVRNGLLHLNTINIDIVPDHTKIFTCMTVDLTTGVVGYLYPRPSHYNVGNWGFASMMTRHCLIYNEREEILVLSHGNAHTLTTMHGNGTQHEIHAGSNYLGPLKPVSKNRSLFIEESEARKHEMKTGFYSSINYDPFREVYYRFVTLPIPESKQHKYKYGELKSIILLDKDFNLLGEHLIPGGYDYSMKFVNRKGLHIFNTEKYHQSNEDSLIFDVFTLVNMN
jgi:hypothetical protein